MKYNECGTRWMIKQSKETLLMVIKNQKLQATRPELKCNATAYDSQLLLTRSVILSV